MTSLLYTHADRQGHGVAFRALVIERIVLKFTNLDIRLKTAKLTKITFNSCIRLKKIIHLAYSLRPKFDLSRNVAYEKN